MMEGSLPHRNNLVCTLFIFVYHCLVTHSFLPAIQTELQGLSSGNGGGFKCRRHVIVLTKETTLSGRK